MCLSRLLVLVSTLPIGIAMGGPQGPEDQSVSSMNHFASNQHAHGIATLARKARQGNQGLLALSTLAAALVFTFLIYRCIVALAPRTKGVKNGVNSRRLSHNIGDACSYENLTEKTEKIEKQDLIEKTEKKEDASRKWLRIGLIFGAATLITGLATMAVSIFQADHHHKAALAITDDHHHGLPLVLPHRPHRPIRPRPIRPTTTTRAATTIETAKAQLMSVLPQNDIELTDKDKKTGYGTFPIANLNARLVNYLLLLKAEPRLTDQDIRDGLAAVAKSNIKTFFEEMFSVADLNKAGKEIQELARRVELAYRPTLDDLMFYAKINQMDYKNYENYKHAAASQMLMKLMPQFKQFDEPEGSGFGSGFTDFTDFKDFFTNIFPVEKMNLLLVNYFLALNQEAELTNKDEIKKALAGATETLTNAVMENIFAVDVLKAGKEVKELADEAKERYFKSISLMINQNMRVALQRRARAAAEAAKHVTPTVAKTVKEIEEGIFTLE